MLLLLSACAGGDAVEPDPVDPPGIATPGAGAFTDGGECPPSTIPDLPAGAACVSSAEAGGEALFLYALLDPGGSPRSWHLHLRSPAGDIDQRLPSGRDYPRVAGASDLEGDGIPEWWVKVTGYASHGAPWSRLNLLINTGGALEPLTLDGEPMAINYGGISRLGEGARCEDDGISLLRTEARDPQNTRWALIERRYRIEGTEASFVGRKEEILRVDSYVDPALRRYFHVECKGVVLVPF